MTVTRLEVEYLLNIVINQDALPRFYPESIPHAFREEIDIMGYVQAVLLDDLDDYQATRLKALNSYLIGKLGKKRYTRVRKDSFEHKLVIRLCERYAIQRTIIAY